MLATPTKSMLYTVYTLLLLAGYLCARHVIICSKNSKKSEILS